MRESSKESTVGGRRWMTESDIADKYSRGRSMAEAQQIAREIVEGKENCAHMRVAHIKPHPDAPLRSDMKLYLIWDESYETSVKDSIVESLFELRDDDSKKKGKSGKDGKSKGSKRKISASSSDSQSESDESESESSSASHRGKRKSAKTAKRRSRGKKEKKEKPIKKKNDDEDQTGPVPVETDKDKKKRMKELEKEKKMREKEEAREKKRIETGEKKEKTKELNKKRSAVRKAGPTCTTSSHKYWTCDS